MWNLCWPTTSKDKARDQRVVQKMPVGRSARQITSGTFNFRLCHPACSVSARILQLLSQTIWTNAKAFEVFYKLSLVFIVPVKSISIHKPTYPHCRHNYQPQQIAHRQLQFWHDNLVCLCGFVYFLPVCFCCQISLYILSQSFPYFSPCAVCIGVFMKSSNLSPLRLSNMQTAPQAPLALSYESRN